MKAKIRSSVKKVQTRESGLAYVSREIIDFNYKLRDKLFQPIIEEVLFVEKEIPEVDDSGEPTGKVKIQRINVEVARRFASTPFPTSSVDGLFSKMGQDIIFSYSFTEKFINLLRTALLLDTKSFSKPLYGIKPEEWILDSE